MAETPNKSTKDSLRVATSPCIFLPGAPEVRFSHKMIHIFQFWFPGILHKTTHKTVIPRQARQAGRPSPRKISTCLAWDLQSPCRYCHLFLIVFFRIFRRSGALESKATLIRSHLYVIVHRTSRKNILTSPVEFWVSAQLPTLTMGISAAALAREIGTARPMNPREGLKAI